MPLQQYLTDELFVTKKLTVSVMNVIKVLAKVEEANQLGRQLPPEAFYNELIRSDPSLFPCLCRSDCFCRSFCLPTDLLVWFLALFLFLQNLCLPVCFFLHV